MRMRARQPIFRGIIHQVCFLSFICAQESFILKLTNYASRHVVLSTYTCCFAGIPTPDPALLVEMVPPDNGSPTNLKLKFPTRAPLGVNKGPDKGSPTNLSWNYPPGMMCPLINLCEIFSIVKTHQLSLNKLTDPQGNPRRIPHY